jgi:hypothetical protein
VTVAASDIDNLSASLTWKEVLLEKSDSAPCSPSDLMESRPCLGQATTGKQAAVNLAYWRRKVDTTFFNFANLLLCVSQNSNRGQQGSRGWPGLVIVVV